MFIRVAVALYETECFYVVPFLSTNIKVLITICDFVMHSILTVMTALKMAPL